MHKHETINALGWQDVLLTSLSPTQKGRYKRGKGWPRPGVFGEAKVEGNFEDDWGMMIMNPYGDMFCHTFDRLLDVWSKSGRSKMMDKYSISAALRQRLHHQKTDVPENILEMRHD